ncbi:uncharacterized protein LOC129587043 [Paramacrobiotus metropolitanus]|uniref:uncharacterized protein LOC129587043 n=1 Tax=Paramacrobiotus metropolitanus TaxID=2943436 RepID=UPI002445FAB5|nr:uncharacterized protein LOC129587043 [Paramacrobiotus metropolitanus]
MQNLNWLTLFLISLVMFIWQLSPSNACENTGANHAQYWENVSTRSKARRYVLRSEPLVHFRPRGINYLDALASWDYFSSPQYLTGPNHPRPSYISTLNADSLERHKKNCRCLANSTCWPSSHEWNVFNATVNGQLIIPRPTAYPCYLGIGFNATQCQTIKDSFSDPHFLVQNAGSMQEFIAEEDGALRCSIEAASIPGSVCQSGRVSAYGVAVQSVSDIQKAVIYARSRNLRLVIKSTGHDYLARSTADGSLLISMHTFAKVETRTSFTPEGCYPQQTVTSPVVIATGELLGMTFTPKYV